MQPTDDPGRPLAVPPRCGCTRDPRGRGPALLGASDSPFLSLASPPRTPAADGAAPAVSRLWLESPFAGESTGLAAAVPEGHDEGHDDDAHAGEWQDDEARDAENLDAPALHDGLAGFQGEDGFDSLDLEAPVQPAPPAPLGDAAKAWVLALDRSAIERLADPMLRKQYLEETDWRTVEFPGNVPKGGVATDATRRHWRLADALFKAMATVVPERRVPATIAYHDPAVERVPGQDNHRLFAEARDAFVRMREAAAADGVALVITSSWRSRKKQADLSRRQANPKAVARGQSAHMYGLAVDLRMSVPGLQVAEANTRTAEKMANLVRMYRSPVYKWMALRGRTFGWHAYRREPWHWEYNPPGLKARFEQAGAEGVPPATAAAPAPAGRGRFLSFQAQAAGLNVGVYAPPAASLRPEVDVLLFAHGLLHVCGGPASAAGLVQHPPFQLSRAIDASGRPVVLVVPEMAWARHQGAHPLSQPATLNALVAEALQALGRAQNTAAPRLGQLAVAGHSRAYAFLGPLARAHGDGQMSRGALARLAQVWALDSTYAYRHTHDAASTLAWLQARPGLRVTIAYRAGSSTSALAQRIGQTPHDRLALIEVPRSQSHCALPVVQLPRLLKAWAEAGSAHEAEADEEADEEADHEAWQFDEASEGGEPAFGDEEDAGCCSRHGEFEHEYEYGQGQGSDWAPEPELDDSEAEEAEGGEPGPDQRWDAGELSAEEDPDSAGAFDELELDAMFEHGPPMGPVAGVRWP